MCVVVDVVVPNICFQRAFWLICLRTWFDYDMCNTRASASILLPFVKCHITYKHHIRVHTVHSALYTPSIANSNWQRLLPPSQPIRFVYYAVAPAAAAVAAVALASFLLDDQIIFFLNSIPLNILEVLYIILYTQLSTCFCEMCVLGAHGVSRRSNKKKQKKNEKEEKTNKKRT